jgi:zinc D-Ala-D-Ala carboxypeptidase
MDGIQALPAKKLATPISRHWTLEEALRTNHLIPNPIEQTLRYGRIHSIEQIRRDLERTARTVLEPLCDKFGKGMLSSGYRCPELNARIHGALNSAHVVGLAFDWLPPAGTTIAAAMTWANAQPDIPFDRLIVEQRGSSRWLHVQAPEADATPSRLLYHSPSAGLFLKLTHEQMLALPV